MDQVTTVRRRLKCEHWKSIISECRSSGMTVTAWCKENGICEQTYYRWQRKIFEIAKAQHEVQFAEVTPVKPVCSHSVAVTVRLSGVEADICNGADAATVETVLRILKLC